VRLRSIGTKLFLSHFLAVLLVSGSIGTYFYFNAADSLLTSLQTRLKNTAALAASALDPADLAGVDGPKDVTKLGYQRTLEELRRFKATNQDIAFLYIMRRMGDEVVFVADSDTSAGQALPGQRYEGITPFLLKGFEGPAVDDTIYEDAWGYFMSGYAPLPGAPGHYLLGVDMRADEVHKKFRRLRLSGVLSLAASVLLAVVFSRVLSLHFTRPISRLADRCLDISEGRLGGRLELATNDELDTLITAVNGMSAGLSESQARSRQSESALTAAKAELEERVAERTRDLTELTERLKLEVAERRKVEAALAEAAATDPLTALLNRRSMGGYLDLEMARFGRSGETFCLVMADIDHFKAVNDTFGHGVGDTVLRDMAALLREAVRSQDLIARWGGEEFLMLLPGTSAEGALVLAEKLRARIEAVSIKAGGRDIRLTVSLGVAAMAPGMSLDDGLKAADDALYRAKAQGRNRVAGPEPV
jgi:diguanylate cyclase (GGDEF)-like protein